MLPHRMPTFPGMYRRNNVPHWQRLHQEHDGIRQWNKVRLDGMQEVDVKAPDQVKHGRHAWLELLERKELCADVHLNRAHVRSSCFIHTTSYSAQPQRVSADVLWDNPQSKTQGLTFIASYDVHDEPHGTRTQDLVVDVKFAQGCRGGHVNGVVTIYIHRITRQPKHFRWAPVRPCVLPVARFFAFVKRVCRT